MVFSDIKRILFYLLFCLVQFCIYTLIISVIAFLEFQLGHTLGDIESWSHSNAWEVFGLVKGVSLFLLLYFLPSFGLGERPKLRSLLEQIRPPSRSVMVVIITCLLSFYWLGVPSDLYEQRNEGMGGIIVSFLGNMIFYGCDLFLIHLLYQKKNYGVKKGLFLVSLYTMAFLMTFHFIFIYGRPYWWHMAYIFSTSLVFLLWRRENFFTILIWIIACGAFPAVFWGLDPLWKDQYSPYALAQGLPSGLYLSLMIGLILYLKLVKKLSDEGDRHGP